MKTISEWEQDITDGHSSGTDFLDIFFNEVRAKMNKVFSEKLISMHNSRFVKYLSFHTETEQVKTGDHMYTLDEYDALKCDILLSSNIFLIKFRLTMPERKMFSLISIRTD